MNKIKLRKHQILFVKFDSIFSKAIFDPSQLFWRQPKSGLETKTSCNISTWTVMDIPLQISNLWKMNLAENFKWITRLFMVRRHQDGNVYFMSPKCYIIFFMLFKRDNFSAFYFLLLDKCSQLKRKKYQKTDIVIVYAYQIQFNDFLI